MTKVEDISEAFVSYYNGLFTTEGTAGMEEFTTGVQARVTTEMNARLVCRFEECEVDCALVQTHPLKSPSPDGFSASFYQYSWSMVHKDVCNVVLQFLNNGHFNKETNATNIALIPKKKNPSRVIDFQPISLCNVVYKLIVKVLANQLKRVLEGIISPNQSAFILGRLITDNVFIFKEKHFRHGTYMEASLGRNPYYAWRSIWNAKPLLGEGMVWRVGDGHSIHIWGDKWLRMKATHESNRLSSF
jgi:hypothetical protein